MSQPPLKSETRPQLFTLRKTHHDRMDTRSGIVYSQLRVSLAQAEIFIGEKNKRRGELAFMMMVTFGGGFCL